MSSGPSSSDVTTYSALQPRLRQRKFPERRRSVKAKPSIPGLRKDQSTLTQLDFVTPTSSRAEVIDSSGDEEFEEPRPKKKRKKSKFDVKEAGQSTMTQFDRGDFPKKAETFALDEDGFQIWEDSDLERLIEEIPKSQNKRGRTLPWLEDPIQDVEQMEPGNEVPETSQATVYPSVRGENGGTANKATAMGKLHTPRKVRFQEVPSSQTPPSTAGSKGSSSKRCDHERSPLKEKSANISFAPPSTALNLESQNIGMKMLERIRFETRKVPLNDVVDQPLSKETAQSAIEQLSALDDSPVETRPRNLTRASTIQDSQSEEAGLSSVSSAEITLPPKRKLKRVSTVQDSQVNDEDSLTPADEIDDKDYYDDLDVVEDSQFQGQYTQQGYFDPANSALDRDALRFGWTQTQAGLPNIREDDGDDETDDDDLDRGYVIKRNDPMDSFTSSPSRQVLSETFDVAPSIKDIGRPPSVPKLHFHRPDSGNDSAFTPSGHASQQEVQVLSSSPPPRPSQVSTVVPTQESVREQFSQRGGVFHNSQVAPIIEPSTIPISPYKPMLHADMMSSSPVPLPPWSSPYKARAADIRQDGDSSPLRSSQLARLVDYSLPPPPPLSSSGRETPVSSLPS